METTIVYWDNMGIMEKKMGNYYGTSHEALARRWFATASDPQLEQWLTQGLRFGDWMWFGVHRLWPLGLISTSGEEFKDYSSLRRLTTWKVLDCAGRGSSATGIGSIHVGSLPSLGLYNSHIPTRRKF